METFIDLLSLITKYMEQSTQPLSFWDGFLKYGIPIIQTVVLLGGAAASLTLLVMSTGLSFDNFVLPITLSCADS